MKRRIRVRWCKLCVRQWGNRPPGRYFLLNWRLSPTGVIHGMRHPKVNEIGASAISYCGLWWVT